MKVRTLLITFDNELPRSKVSLFRGAIINAVGGDDMFHNHGEGDNYLYRYPLIQYKRIHQRAAIFTIEQGTEQIGKLLNLPNLKLQIGEDDITFNITNVIPGNFQIQVWDTKFHYYLRNWLALNQENYGKYLSMETVIERTQYLQQILTGNILSLCKGLGILIEERIECNITQMDNPRKVYYKGTPLMGFDIEFTSNISLPDYIGIGKAVSVGHGTVVRKHPAKNNNNNKLITNPLCQTE